MEQATDIDLATNDLGPLAWVLDELRKSLESGSAALRRFVRDTALARGSDMASVDGGQLRIARQQLHQAVGALEMVGLGAPAHMLRAMEAAVQKFIERPELCTEAAASKVERAGFALTEYLEGVLLGKGVSPVALFPQYRDAQELAGAERIHPADLWSLDWRWTEPQTPVPGESMVYDPAVRSRMDQSVLKLVKTLDRGAADELAAISLSLASTQGARQPKIFWKICAGYFEAMGLGLLPPDMYVKRAASRILVQYAALAKGELGVSDRLALDLVFFCSQAQPPAGASCPSLVAVREAWNLARFTPVDYQVVQFGRFDPAMLAQSRKRISAARETWSALSGGDANKLKSVGEQFHLVSDSLVKLHPQSGALAQAMNNVVDSVVRAGRPPGPELAMEVATAVLYLEAAFVDLDPSEQQLSTRTARLAERLDRVRQGGQPEPLETWMEELYRRVSDRQTMGSVVGELRGTLGELEKLLDQYFRNLQDKAPLRDAPSHLAQMRGVLSVLGLDQASHAVQRMRDSVEEIIITEIDEEHARQAGTFDKLGNNLGALGFLIDMLNYQPSLAKKLFVYDEDTGELRPLMGRAGAVHQVPDADEPQQHAQPAAEPTVAFQAPAPAVSLDSTVIMQRPAIDAEALARMAREAAAAVTAEDPTVAVSAFSKLDEVVSAAPVAPFAPVAAAVAAAPADEEDDDFDLLDIFLEEAREVVQNGLAAIGVLASNPGDIGELTTLRRAFHTLKGSSRMVGLNEFGEAAWSMEQVLNTWLADQKGATDELRVLARDAMEGFARWVEDIAAHIDSAWKSSMFRIPADSLRTEGRLLQFALPGAAVTPASVEEDETVAMSAMVAELPAVEHIDFNETHVFRGDAPEVAEISAAELPPEFEVAESSAEISMDVPAFDAPVPHSVPPAVEIEGIDFASLAEVAGPAPEPAIHHERASHIDEPARVVDDMAFDLGTDRPHDDEQAVIEDFELDFPQAVAPEAAAGEGSHEAPREEDKTVVMDAGEATQVFSFESLAPAVEISVTPDPAEADVEETVVAAMHHHAEPVDDQVKVIGTLRIGIPLYNVYLNEADEWSRRLATEVAEWALELNQPVGDSTVGLAHALAGSSATVGFHALSDIARALEDALHGTQRLAWATPQHGRAFTDAADEIRRLLHQFAAGFLKEPAPGVVDALLALRELEIPQRADQGDEADELRSDFGGLDSVDDLQSAAAPGAELMPQVAQHESADEPLAPEPAVELTPITPITLVTPVAPAVQAPVQPAMPVFEAPSNVAASERRTVTGEHDPDDLDITDAIDPDLFPIFEEEATELMPQLGGALRQWAARPENRSARDEALRALHTLKGSARLAGALRLGELAHRLESEIEQLGMEGLSTASVEPLLQHYDGMQANFEALRAVGGAPAEEPVVEATVAPAAVEPDPARPAATAQPVVTKAETVAWTQVTQRALSVATQQLAPARSTSNQAVRVRSQLLDRLVNQAGEVMITRSRLEAELRQLRSSLTDLTGNLDRLRTQLRDIELQAETQMQSRLAQAKDSAQFDPLEFDRFTRVQELTRMMAESVNDVATVQRNLQRTVEATEDDLIAQARQTRELQRDLLRTRMVEFESISDRLYRVIRLASKETGKQVKLDITGGSIEMDRGVLDRMTPAFEHLLRNCVAHGIEDPAARTAAGKDANGTILIGLHHEGNDVSVEFRDDGAGLNVARIREKALQQGLIRPEQELSDQEAANLIFMPGFSTATTVTELSGRGIGMDVVRSEVNALGGRIETATQAGQGTSFRLVLPLTTAVTQVVMIRSGKQSIGVPANVIEIVRRATPKEVEQAYNSGFYEFGGEQLPFYWSGALLQSSPRSVEPQSRTLPVVVFRSAAQRIAVHVDEVLGNQEVVVKNLGPQLARLPGLAGMTVLASGAVVLIYNPVALSTVYGDQARSMSADHAQPEVLEQRADGTKAPGRVMAVAPQVPLVLVVDDSITVRRVTQRLLQREGYRVSLAADGLQALERLADELPTVVLSDIEMPRMDGFDLARNIRGDSRTRHLPIIMITSRIAEKHREHAKELGVDHYLGKPYSEEELLSLVKHYSTAAAALA